MLRRKSSDTKRTIRNFAIGAALTALAGYVAGILTAPKSGKETREQIKSKANETYSAAEKELKKLHTELTDVIDEISDRIEDFRGNKNVNDALEKGKGAKQKAREVLSSLHDGEVEDKDLKKAIQDASKAIEHLRDFLRK